MKLFKGIGDLLRVGRDGVFKSLGVVLSPLKSIAVKMLSSEAKKSIEGQVKEHLLGYLAQEYEDKVMAKAVDYVEHLFNLIEKTIPLFPDFLEPSILKKVQALEAVILKFLDRMDARLDEMKKDGKITNSELDEIMEMITEELFVEIKAVFADVVDMFSIESKVKADRALTADELGKIGIQEVKPAVFSQGANKYLQALKEKYEVKK